MKAWETVIKDLKEHPEQFQQEDYVLVRKSEHEIKYAVWTANGFFFYSLYKPVRKFSLYGKIRFWLAYRKFIQNSPF